jgi:hypothetical protein
MYELQEIPSTFHQFLNFSHEGKEVTLYVDSKPFHFCAKLEEKYKQIQHIPSNDIAFHSFSYVDPSIIPSTSLKPTSKNQPKVETKVQVLNKGHRNYFFNQAFCIDMLLPIPKI